MKKILLDKLLDETSINSFLENGFLIVPQLLAETEIKEITNDIPKILKGEYPSSKFSFLPKNSSEQEVLDSFLCLHFPHTISPIMENYLKHPKICGILDQIVGAHLYAWEGGVKSMQSMLFSKPAGAPGQGWHQDEFYIPTRDRSMTGAWIALDDANLENGCLWVIPGSHKKGILYQMDEPLEKNEKEYGDTGIAHGFDENQKIPVEVKRGDVVYFNGYLLHKSMRNNSQATRRVLVNHYMSCVSELPWNKLPEADGFIGNDCREVIHVSGQDPIHWKPTYARDKTHFRARTVRENEKSVS
ncbi:MAG: phytanoyl-CoA dioxygenase [Planctomycetota bacterium]|nr:MAG: phytanoyl-CoA dioxygenase [Planctomycetota bacterium]